MNYFKTLTLLIVLTMLLVWAGGAFGGQQGAQMAFMFALVLNGVSYWFSDKIALAMHRAKPVTPEEAPELYALVQRLSDRAHLPMPKLYVMALDTPNAFATGRNPKHAAVAVTDGLLRLTDHAELEGVLAHELGHIKNRDTLIMTVAATIAGAITMMAYWARWAALFGGFGGRDRRGGDNVIGLLAMAIVAPLAALLVQTAISRSREYAADKRGAEFAGNPYGLAGALEKLENYNQRYPMVTQPTSAHLFIVNPLKGNGLATLFSTHPPIDERIARLRSMRV